MSDYIKREDALILCKPLSNYEETLKEILELIPSADVVERNTVEYTTVWTDNEPIEYVERKRGEWLRKDGRVWSECSVCGSGSSFETKFCGNCGADMRGEE